MSMLAKILFCYSYHGKICPYLLPGKRLSVLSIAYFLMNLPRYYDCKMYESRSGNLKIDLTLPAQLVSGIGVSFFFDKKQRNLLII